VRAEDLSAEDLDGLLLNIPSHEASDALGLVMAIGASLGGKGEDASDYLDRLADIAYDESPDVSKKFKEMVKISDAKRDIFHANKDAKATPIKDALGDLWKKK
jgi:hypothetical protein